MTTSYKKALSEIADLRARLAEADKRYEKACAEMAKERMRAGFAEARLAEAERERDNERKYRQKLEADCDNNSTTRAQLMTERDAALKERDVARTRSELLQRERDEWRVHTENGDRTLDAALKDVAALKELVREATLGATCFESGWMDRARAAWSSPHPGAEWFASRMREVAERAWDDGYSAGSGGSVGQARRREGIDGAMEKP